MISLVSSLDDYFVESLLLSWIDLIVAVGETLFLMLPLLLPRSCEADKFDA